MTRLEYLHSIGHRSSKVVCCHMQGNDDKSDMLTANMDDC